MPQQINFKDIITIHNKTELGEVEAFTLAFNGFRDYKDNLFKKGRNSSDYKLNEKVFRVLVAQQQAEEIKPRVGYIIKIVVYPHPIDDQKYFIGG